MALEPGIQKRSWIVAIVVGSILNIINQGDALFNGNPIVIWKLALTFCVPYCVATYGAVSARKANP
ncbi:MAG: nitrate/nitrite transporter NrtS [Porticoccaceae bacterium]|nr:nitrate/nitrite transporter NrtS [Porticoccaceae bacterium]